MRLGLFLIPLAACLGCANLERRDVDPPDPIPPDAPYVEVVPDASPVPPDECPPPPPPPCGCDDDCGYGQSCRHGTCYDRCDCNDDCGEGERCSWGVCKPY